MNKMNIFYIFISLQKPYQMKIKKIAQLDSVLSFVYCIFELQYFHDVSQYVIYNTICIKIQDLFKEINL